jgi:CheY-like chemotaxis protein
MAAILVVDDNGSALRFIARLLEREGHVVAAQEQAAEALALFDARPFDLVVTDLFMSGMDGLDLIRALRERAPAMPIVAMSGDLSPTRSAVFKAAEASGAVCAIAKPFAVAEFRAMVRTILDESRAA